MSTEPTIAELVAKANEIKEYLKAEDDAHEARLKPYRDGLVAINGATLAYLQENNLQNVKVDGEGTAYQQTTMSVKVDNREAFLDFVATNNKWGMVDVGALKDPVKDWLDTSNGVPPPGIVISFFTKCNIRRS